MNIKPLIAILVLSLTLSACSPTRHEMPITTSSEEARELFIKGRDFAENEQPEEAMKYLNAAIQLDPEFALAHLWTQTAGGLSKANQLIKQVSQGESIMIKSWAKYWEGDFKLCGLLVDSLVKLFPKDKHCLFYAGNTLFNRDEIKAVSYYNQAVKLDRYYAAPYANIGIQMMRLENYDKAEEALIRYLDLRPNSGKTLRAYGDLLRKRGNAEEALIQYSRSLMIDTANTAVHANIIWIYINQGTYKQAARECENIYQSVLSRLSHDLPVDVEDLKTALGLMASIQYIQYNVEGSLEIIDKLINHLYQLNDMPNLFWAYYLKAWCEMEGGKEEKAISTLSQALESERLADLDHQNRMSKIMWFHGTMSILYLKMEDQDKADYHLQLARSSFIESEKSTNDLNLMNLFDAVFALNKSDNNLAISLLERPARLASTSCQYYLAQAYELSGQKDQAIKYYQIVNQNTDPHFAGLFYNKSKKKLEELGK